MSRFKAVIFDLDETLVHKPVSPDAASSEAWLRPGSREVLQSLKQDFEVGLFTTADRKHAEEMLELLDPHRDLVDFCLDRSHCIEVKPNVWIKDLRVLQNRKLSEMLVVDNNLYCAALNLSNAIPILPFKGDATDRQLFKLRGYLLSLASRPQQTDLLQANDRYFGFDLIASCKANISQLPNKLLARIESLARQPRTSDCDG